MTDQSPVQKTVDRKHKSTVAKVLIIMVIAAGLVLLGFASVRAYQYTASPAAIRNPKLDHYHFRTQLYVNGDKVNFGKENFQTDYDAGQCSDDLPESPIHFHDNTDQMTHIHWDGMTGGLLLKNYGWNFIGGSDNTLGWRFDNGYVVPREVPIHGNDLPGLPENTDYYVYIKTADGYERKDWNNFLQQDFETFFGTKSSLGWWQGIVNWFMPTAHAHNGEDHSADEINLEKLNNLIGDVAIFVQPNEPSSAEIEKAFSTLIELPESSCAG